MKHINKIIKEPKMVDRKVTHWKLIEWKGIHPTKGTIMLDIVDVNDCSRENKPHNCYKLKCPYVKECNDYEQGTINLAESLGREVIPELFEDRN